MLRTGFVVLAVAWAAFSQDASRPAPATRPAPRLRLELSTRTPKVAPGEWLKFSAVLFNEGREPVTVVLPGDGSTEGGGRRSSDGTRRRRPEGVDAGTSTRSSPRKS